MGAAPDPVLAALAGADAASALADATVTQVRWNHNCTKLASSDDSGLIIVFMFDEQVRGGGAEGGAS